MHDEEVRYLLEKVGIDEAEIAKRQIDADLWGLVPIEERYVLEGEEGIAQLEATVSKTEMLAEMAVAFPTRFNDADKMVIMSAHYQAEEALRRARERLEGATE